MDRICCWNTRGLNRSTKQIEKPRLSLQTWKARVVGSTYHFLCTFVYGYNEAAAREVLLIDLIDIANKSNLPWLILGDFNNVLNFKERVGAPVREEEIKDFRHCLQSCSLTDIKCLGNFYTWNNK
ncbi:UDP-N-acetylenolpyruvoylglucosamine reductase [Bienertia sinuspersici]